jgi:two-component system NtrC family sensor kinase
VRRRSKASGKLANALSRKTAAPRPGSAPKSRSRRPAKFGQKAAIAALARALNEAREQQFATTEVLRVISSSPGDLVPVFQSMLANATRICDASFGSMVLREGDGFRRVALHNAPREFAEYNERMPHIALTGSSTLYRIATTKQVLHLPVEDDHDSPLVKYAGARTVLGVPLLKDNEVVGVFGIYRQEVRPFTDRQIELAKNFAAQAVIAIENTRLLNELRQSLQQQTATADVLKVISRSTFDLKAVLNTLVESAARLCEADAVTLARPKGTSYQFEATFGHSREFEEYVASHPARIDRGTATGRTLVEGKIVHIPDVLADSEYTYTESVKLSGIRTLLGVPLLREGIPIGVFVLGRRVVRPFSDKQIELVTTFADQAVIAIENVRLFEAEQQRTRELSESLDQQTATSEVLRVISSSPSELTPVFQSILANATRLCEANFGTLNLHDNGSFPIVAAHNAPEAYVEHRRRHPLVKLGSRHPLARVAASKQVLQIADIRTEPLYREKDPSFTAMVDLARARTLFVVPMLKDNELLGAITIFRQEIRPFTEKQIALVRNFAAQAVIAIENTRLLNELRQRTNDLSESLEQQTATSEVLRVISSSPGELGPVFQAMLENATRICEAKFGSLLRFDGKAAEAARRRGRD